jgi:hypothetical protein
MLSVMQHYHQLPKLLDLPHLLLPPPLYPAAVA